MLSASAYSAFHTMPSILPSILCLPFCRLSDCALNPIDCAFHPAECAYHHLNCAFHPMHALCFIDPMECVFLPMNCARHPTDYGMCLPLYGLCRPPYLMRMPSYGLYMPSYMDSAFQPLDCALGPSIKYVTLEGVREGGGGFISM